MTTQESLRILTSLRCEHSITEHLIELVSEYLATSARVDEITSELYLLGVLCNHHRSLLSDLYRRGKMPNQLLLNTWLYELATPPTTEWANLRHMLNPFIRTFGMIPRPKGSSLFSPLEDFLSVDDVNPRKNPEAIDPVQGMSCSLNPGSSRPWPQGCER